MECFLFQLIYEASPEEVSFRHVLHLINAAQEEGRNQVLRLYISHWFFIFICLNCFCCQAERELRRGEAFVHPFLRRVAANGED